MYTRLTFWAEISEDAVNSQAIHAITQMMNVSPPEWVGMPVHPFFHKNHAWGVLRGSSYYHNTGRTTWIHDQGATTHFLNVDVSLKNYDGEILSFLDWIRPYDFVHGELELSGFYLYEEDVHPTLIYKDETRPTYIYREVTA